VTKRTPLRVVSVAAAIFISQAIVNCLAQEPARDHSCTVGAAAVFASPFGQDRDNFNHGGWGFQAGGGFAVTRQAEPNHGGRWYITGNYLYDKFRVRESAMKEVLMDDQQLAGAKSAHGDFSAVTLDPNYRWTFNRRSSLYLTGGFGWMHRGIGFNGLSKVPPLLPSSTSLGGAASNSGVFDFGVGVNFSPKPLRGLMLFTEGRVYHGTAINSGSTLVPVSIGVRW
jgi:hypothetical protein